VIAGWTSWWTPLASPRTWSRTTWGSCGPPSWSRAPKLPRPARHVLYPGPATVPRSPLGGRDQSPPGPQYRSDRDFRSPSPGNQRRACSFSAREHRTFPDGGGSPASVTGRIHHCQRWDLAYRRPPQRHPARWRSAVIDITGQSSKHLDAFLGRSSASSSPSATTSKRSARISPAPPAPSIGASRSVTEGEDAGTLPASNVCRRTRHAHRIPGSRSRRGTLMRVDQPCLTTTRHTTPHIPDHRFIFEEATP